MLYTKHFHHNSGFYPTEVFIHYLLKTVKQYQAKNPTEHSNSCSAAPVVSVIHCLMLFPYIKSPNIFLIKGWQAAFYELKQILFET